MSTIATNTRKRVARLRPEEWIETRRHSAFRRISPEDLVQDRAFWTALLDLRRHSSSLPPHTAGGFRNRRFAIIRDAAWITLYRAVSPYPQIGVFLRCTNPAGEAFFTLADHARHRIEAHLRAGLGPGAELEWGSSHHPGMTDIAAMMAAPLPWDHCAAGFHTAWLLRIGAAWWTMFSSLADPPGRMLGRPHSQVGPGIEAKLKRTAG